MVPPLDVLSIGGAGGWIRLARVAEEFRMTIPRVRKCLAQLGVPVCEAFEDEWVHPIAISRELVRRSFPDEFGAPGEVDEFVEWLTRTYGAARRSAILETLRGTKRAFEKWKPSRGKLPPGKRQGVSSRILRERGDRAGGLAGDVDDQGGDRNSVGDNPLPGDEGE